MPLDLPRLGATAWAETMRPWALARAFCAMAALTAHKGDNGVVAFAINAAGIRRFFQRVDRQQAFHKNFKEFDETAEFLHGDDQRVIFFAEMLFHVLRGLPIHQFALCAVGAAL